MDALGCTLGEFWKIHAKENSVLLKNVPTNLKQLVKDGGLLLEWHFNANQVCDLFPEVIYSP